MGWFLPAIPALKICLGFWIMLPQFKGEFYLWHMLEEYLKKVEHHIMAYRCTISSNLVRFFAVLASGSLKMCVTYISEECIVKTDETAKEIDEILRTEMEIRVEKGGVPDQNDFGGLGLRSPSHVDNTHQP